MLNSLRWSSLIPQGQCMLSPLIIAILDTSKFYDYLVKMIFKLHSQVPPDALEGHRSRFRVIFERTKKFYVESSNLQYFKYLVSIPTLPSVKKTIVTLIIVSFVLERTELPSTIRSRLVSHSTRLPAL